MTEEEYGINRTIDLLDATELQSLTSTNAWIATSLPTQTTRFFEPSTFAKMCGKLLPVYVAICTELPVQLAKPLKEARKGELDLNNEVKTPSSSKYKATIFFLF